MEEEGTIETKAVIGPDIATLAHLTGVDDLEVEIIFEEEEILIDPGLAVHARLERLEGILVEIVDGLPEQQSPRNRRTEGIFIGIGTSIVAAFIIIILQKFWPWS